MPEQTEKPLEWHLMFVIEDTEAELRYRHILKSFQEDLHVAEVETSNNQSEPTLFGLIVRFRHGKTEPANVSLRHLDKVFGTSPLVRRSRYERLMSDDVLDDDEKSRS